MGICGHGSGTLFTNQTAEICLVDKGGMSRDKGGLAVFGS